MGSPDVFPLFQRGCVLLLPLMISNFLMTALMVLSSSLNFFKVQSCYEFFNALHGVYDIFQIDFMVSFHMGITSFSISFLISFLSALLGMTSTFSLSFSSRNRASPVRSRRSASSSKSTRRSMSLSFFCSFLT